MEHTKIKHITSKKELDEFLETHDVISVQTIIVGGQLQEAFLRGGGTIINSVVNWSVWYKS